MADDSACSVGYVGGITVVISIGCQFESVTYGRGFVLNELSVLSHQLVFVVKLMGVVSIRTLLGSLPSHRASHVVSIHLSMVGNTYFSLLLQVIKSVVLRAHYIINMMVVLSSSGGVTRSMDAMERVLSASVSPSRLVLLSFCPQQKFVEIAHRCADSLISELSGAHRCADSLISDLSGDGVNRLVEVSGHSSLVSMFDIGSSITPGLETWSRVHAHHWIPLRTFGTWVALLGVPK
jgi:hypothetical protein